MELEKLNKQYQAEKATYETLKLDEKRLQMLKLVKHKARANYNKMLEENDEANIMGKKVPHNKGMLEAAKNKAEAAEKQLQDFEKQIQNALDKVNNRFAELEQDPEMKAHLNNALAKRMERSIRKEEDKRDSYKEIKEIFEAHPNAKDIIKKAIVNRNKEIAILEGKIQQLEEKQTRTPDEENELKNSKLQLSAVKTELANKKAKIEKDFLQKRYPNLSEETKAVLFGLNTVNMDRAIKGTERNIQNRKNVYREVTGKELETEQRRQAPQTGSGPRTQLPVEVKLPWYKRLWHWIKTGERSTQPGPQTQQPSRAQEENQSKFRNSYKYDVVKDYAKQKEEELLKQHNERKKQQQRQDEGR